jgi:hypothetical protein
MKYFNIKVKVLRKINIPSITELRGRFKSFFLDYLINSKHEIRGQVGEYLFSELTLPIEKIDTKSEKTKQLFLYDITIGGSFYEHFSEKEVFRMLNRGHGSCITFLEVFYLLYQQDSEKKFKRFFQNGKPSHFLVKNYEFPEDRFGPGACSVIKKEERCFISGVFWGQNFFYKKENSFSLVTHCEIGNHSLSL